MARTTSPAEYAILGLLAAQDGAGHGYDLARNFADGEPLGEVLHLEPGMLYHHLKKMERAGWVESTMEQPGPRPPRHVYRPTAAGSAELERWLAAPVSHTREIRLDFLVKLYFARQSDPHQAHHLIDQQRAACRSVERRLLEQMSELDEADGATADRDFTRTVLDLRLAQTRAAIAWLDGIDGATR
jgi:DNA-binding PadR family transcriptional regulator